MCLLSGFSILVAQCVVNVYKYIYVYEYMIWLNEWINDFAHNNNNNNKTMIAFDVAVALTETAAALPDAADFEMKQSQSNKFVQKLDDFQPSSSFSANFFAGN